MAVDTVKGLTVPKVTLTQAGRHPPSPPKQEKKKTRPEPERLKLKGDRESFVQKALKKSRPKKGWGKTKL